MLMGACGGGCIQLTGRPWGDRGAEVLASCMRSKWRRLTIDARMIEWDGPPGCARVRVIGTVHRSLHMEAATCQWVRVARTPHTAQIDSAYTERVLMRHVRAAAYSRYALCRIG